MDWEFSQENFMRIYNYATRAGKNPDTSMLNGITNPYRDLYQTVNELYIFNTGARLRTHITLVTVN